MDSLSFGADLSVSAAVYHGVMLNAVRVLQVDVTQIDKTRLPFRRQSWHLFRYCIFCRIFIF